MPSLCLPWAFLGFAGPAENVLDFAENVLDFAENVLDFVENVLDFAENVLDFAENVLDFAENVQTFSPFPIHPKAFQGSFPTFTEPSRTFQGFFPIPQSLPKLSKPSPPRLSKAPFPVSQIPLKPAKALP